MGEWRQSNAQGLEQWKQFQASNPPPPTGTPLPWGVGPGNWPGGWESRDLEFPLEKQPQYPVAIPQGGEVANPQVRSIETLIPIETPSIEIPQVRSIETLIPIETPSIEIPQSIAPPLPPPHGGDQPPPPRIPH